MGHEALAGGCVPQTQGVWGSSHRCTGIWRCCYSQGQPKTLPRAKHHLTSLGTTSWALPDAGSSSPAKECTGTVALSHPALPQPHPVLPSWQVGDAA